MQVIGRNVVFIPALHFSQNPTWELILFSGDRKSIIWVSKQVYIFVFGEGIFHVLQDGS